MIHLDILYHWIQERIRIRDQKNAGELLPWTDDPIMAKYRFCNVHREDDKVTEWIATNWRRPNENDPGLPFAMAVARMINHPPTLAELGYPTYWDADHFVRVIAKRKGEKQKVWTSAYMITGGFSAGGQTKEDIIARVLTTLWDNLQDRNVEHDDTLAVAAAKLTVPGIGTFLSAQIVADLKYTPYLNMATDWWSWCSPGPGSTIGLNILNERPWTTAVSPSNFRREVALVQKAIEDGIGLELHAQDTQNCLCEFSKYFKALKDIGRPKAQYSPDTDQFYAPLRAGVRG